MSFHIPKEGIRGREIMTNGIYIHNPKNVENSKLSWSKYFKFDFLGKKNSSAIVCFIIKIVGNTIESQFMYL